MKKIVHTTILILATAFSVSASVNTATINGNWTSASTWSLNRVPANNDTIVIPAGKTVTVTSIISTTNNWFIKIYGVLQFDGGKLDMSSTSRVWLFSTGIINSNGNSSSDALRINSVDKYRGNQGTITGEKFADVTTGTPDGFATQASPLPVIFVGFNTARQNNDVLVQWSTAQEMNSSYYEVQRSENGNDWNTIATIKAAGNTSITTSYSYTDRGVTSRVAYYRIRQFDLDGKFIVTAIRMVKNETSNTEIKINAASVNSVYVHFSQQVKGNVVVRISSTTGQMIAQQSVNNPVGQVMIPVQNAKAGVFVVTVTDGEDLKFSKQILL